jgi:hypothetical protein
MGFVLRYALLLTLLVVSVLAFIGATTVTGERVLVDAGASTGAPGGAGFWVLIAIGVGIAVSLGRRVYSEIPEALGDLWHDNKERLFTLLLGAAVCALFVLS